MPAVLRKERVHLTGNSNRAFNHNRDGPRDFDHDARSHAPRLWTYKMPTQVPMAKGFDFDQESKGFLLRFPQNKTGSPKKGKTDLSAEATQKSAKSLQSAKSVGSVGELQKSSRALASKPSDAFVIKAPPRGPPLQEVMMNPMYVEDPELENVKPHNRWKARHWWEAPTVWHHPLKKEEGETWNRHDSLKPRSERKATDKLFRAVRSKAELKHLDEMDPEYVEYYQHRDIVDAMDQDPSNDYEVRPTYLPDFIKPVDDNDPASHARVKRIKEVLQGRYGGRPGLMNIFKHYAMTVKGYIFPKDLQHSLAQMGLKVSLEECKHLIATVDRDAKGSMNFSEFADFVYQPSDPGTNTRDVSARFLTEQTKNLVRSLLNFSAQIGTAFCNVDPERNYLVSKAQFANAITSAVNHVTSDAIDYLWGTQFTELPPEDMIPEKVHEGMIDWRSFMHQLEYFSNEHRLPTPCTLQGRKSNYDQLQRTAALTDGKLPPVDLNRPDHDPDNEILLVADKIVTKEKTLAFMPAKASFLTPAYIDYIQTKSNRAQRALRTLISEERLVQLVNRRMTRNEIVDTLMEEIEKKNEERKKGQQSLTIDTNTDPNVPIGPTVVPAFLRMDRADIQSFVSCELANGEQEIDPTQFITSIYHDKLPLEEVNDALNRTLRLHPPTRQRPATEPYNPRYKNKWQARFVMELIQEALEKKHTSNGGRLKVFNIFKRLDTDGDGYVSLQDLQKVANKYQIHLNPDDAHAFLTECDPSDQGAVDLPDFTKGWQIYQGCFLDGMQKPVRGVFRSGGALFGGPVQDRHREEMAVEAAEAEKDRKEFEAAQTRRMQQSTNEDGPISPRKSGSFEGNDTPKTQTPTSSLGSQSPMERDGRNQQEPMGSSARARSEPPQTPGSIVSSIPSSYRDPVVYRISDVISNRCRRWKPHKRDPLPIPPTRFARTLYPDTRHITEPMDPRSGSYLHDAHRFTTTYLSTRIDTVPDPICPQVRDAMDKRATTEFRVDRIQKRNEGLALRREASDAVYRDFDEKRIARKALDKLNYERRVRMSCCFS